MFYILYMRKIMWLPHQNYLAKIDLDSSVFLYEHPVYMSVQVVMIPLGITMTWTNIKTGYSQRITESSKSVLVRQIYCVHRNKFT